LIYKSAWLGRETDPVLEISRQERITEMSIRKSLIVLAALALAMMGFASMASAAEDGTVVDVKTGEPMEPGEELHLVGWAEFHNHGNTGIICHVTSVLVAHDDTTGTVTNFSIPDTTKCKGTNALAQCKVKSDPVTNLPYHATATPPDAATPAGQIDVTGNIVIHNKLEGFLCPGEITLTFSEIILKPLETGGNPITGGAGLGAGAGNTAEAGDPIAGVEIRGTGTSHIGGLADEVQATGELELTKEDICTWIIE
jgi:hypothetical protein